ncbi:hypothetical protein ID866_5241, partial [Astraeus odoratus]
MSASQVNQRTSPATEAIVVKHHLRSLLALSLVSRLLICVLIVSSTALLTVFDASPRLVLDDTFSAWTTSLLRWDAFHFAHVADEGRMYEYEWAFFPGVPLIMRWSGSALSILGLSAPGWPALLRGGALAAVFFDSTCILYQLSLHHLRSPSAAFLAAALSLLSSSAATLRGMLACVRAQWLLASLCFAAASTFRSNGILLCGFIVWGMLVVPFLSARKDLLSVKRLSCCVALVALPLIPFVFHNFQAYLLFCSAGGARPEWCENRMGPSIYSYVQLKYWNVGFLRYWTIPNIPHFLLALPVFLNVYIFCVFYLSHLAQVVPQLFRQSRASDLASDSLFLNASVLPHVLHGLALALILTFNAHVQIGLRVLPSLPVTYWAAARLLIERPRWGKANNVQTTVDSGSSTPPARDVDAKHGQAPRPNTLRRGLSARQVQMIAIAGTIGTGLFLGTGRSLAQGGPASMLICYAIVGLIVYVTLLLLGEMATQYPVAGSFNAYATRFFSPSYGFALSWNYWFNDAVSVASDLTAAQLVLQFWTTWHPWVASVLIWLFLVSVNASHVKAYGELEYWLSFLKVVTVIAFIIVGVLVNVGVNTSHTYIGFHNWSIPGAPFVGGFGGFAKVFVTASFAYGGTESLGITAGETRNPSRNMPRVVKFVFWRILIFYVLSILLIGLNVPWNYPNLSDKTTTTSPFTIVFQLAGSTVAASFMNTVILTSVLSAGNHALFAGTRVLYGLSVVQPRRHAPSIFSKTTSAGVPIFALLATSSVSVLCFASSYVGSGELWGWLQNIVGVSNQIAWLSIGLASWRFRKAWIKQGRPIEELKFCARWTWPWGPYFVMFTVSALILIQGWTSVFPKFSPVDFISFYIEVPIMIVMYAAWLFVRRAVTSKANVVTPASPPSDSAASSRANSESALLTGARKRKANVRAAFDIVDLSTVDLYEDEYREIEEDVVEDEQRN